MLSLRAASEYSVLRKISVVFEPRETTKYILKNMVYNCIIGKIFESSFLINLFRNTNIARVFYKSSQTCGTETKSDR
jgi:hypothetical protein